jgi:hypothetical protein
MYDDDDDEFAEIPGMNDADFEIPPMTLVVNVPVRKPAQSAKPANEEKRDAD